MAKQGGDGEKIDYVNMKFKGPQAPSWQVWPMPKGWVEKVHNPKYCYEGPGHEKWKYQGKYITKADAYAAMKLYQLEQYRTYVKLHKAENHKEIQEAEVVAAGLRPWFKERQADKTKVKNVRAKPGEAKAKEPKEKKKVDTRRIQPPATKFNWIYQNEKLFDGFKFVKTTSSQIFEGPPYKGHPTEPDGKDRRRHPSSYQFIADMLQHNRAKTEKFLKENGFDGVKEVALAYKILKGEEDDYWTYESKKPGGRGNNEKKSKAAGSTKQTSSKGTSNKKGTSSSSSNSSNSSDSSSSDSSSEDDKAKDKKPSKTGTASASSSDQASSKQDAKNATTARKPSPPPPENKASASAAASASGSATVTATSSKPALDKNVLSKSNQEPAAPSSSSSSTAGNKMTGKGKPVPASSSSSATAGAAATGKSSDDKKPVGSPSSSPPETNEYGEEVLRKADGTIDWNNLKFKGTVVPDLWAMPPGWVYLKANPRFCYEGPGAQNWKYEGKYMTRGDAFAAMMTYQRKEFDQFVKEHQCENFKEIREAKAIFEGKRMWYHERMKDPNRIKENRAKPGTREKKEKGKGMKVMNTRLPKPTTFNWQHINNFPAGWSFAISANGCTRNFHGPPHKDGTARKPTKVAYHLFTEMLKDDKVSAEKFIAENGWEKAPEVEVAYKILAGEEITYEEWEERKKKKREEEKEANPEAEAERIRKREEHKLKKNKKQDKSERKLQKAEGRTTIKADSDEKSSDSSTSSSSSDSSSDSSDVDLEDSEQHEVLDFVELLHCYDANDELDGREPQSDDEDLYADDFDPDLDVDGDYANLSLPFRKWAQRRQFGELGEKIDTIDRQLGADAGGGALPIAKEETEKFAKKKPEEDKEIETDMALVQGMENFFRHWDAKWKTAAVLGEEACEQSKLPLLAEWLDAREALQMGREEPAAKICPETGLPTIEAAPDEATMQKEIREAREKGLVKNQASDLDKSDDNVPKLSLTTRYATTNRPDMPFPEFDDVFDLLDPANAARQPYSLVDPPKKQRASVTWPKEFSREDEKNLLQSLKTIRDIDAAPLQSSKDCESDLIRACCFLQLMIPSNSDYDKEKDKHEKERLAKHASSGATATASTADPEQIKRADRECEKYVSQSKRVFDRFAKEEKMSPAALLDAKLISTPVDLCHYAAEQLDLLVKFFDKNPRLTKTEKSARVIACTEQLLAQKIAMDAGRDVADVTAEQIQELKEIFVKEARKRELAKRLEVPQGKAGRSELLFADESDSTEFYDSGDDVRGIKHNQEVIAVDLKLNTVKEERNIPAELCTTEGSDENSDDGDPEVRKNIRLKRKKREQKNCAFFLQESVPVLTAMKQHKKAAEAERMDKMQSQLIQRVAERRLEPLTRDLFEAHLVDWNFPELFLQEEDSEFFPTLEWITGSEKVVPEDEISAALNKVFEGKVAEEEAPALDGSSKNKSRKGSSPRPKKDVAGLAAKSGNTTGQPVTGDSSSDDDEYVIPEGACFSDADIAMDGGSDSTTARDEVEGFTMISEEELLTKFGSKSHAARNVLRNEAAQDRKSTLATAQGYHPLALHDRTQDDGDEEDADVDEAGSSRNTTSAAVAVAARRGGPFDGCYNPQVREARKALVNDRTRLERESVETMLLKMGVDLTFRPEFFDRFCASPLDTYDTTNSVDFRANSIISELLQVVESNDAPEDDGSAADEDRYWAEKQPHPSTLPWIDILVPFYDTEKKAEKEKQLLEQASEEKEKSAYFQAYPGAFKAEEKAWKKMRLYLIKKKKAKLSEEEVEAARMKIFANAPDLQHAAKVAASSPNAEQQSSAAALLSEKTLHVQRRFTRRLMDKRKYWHAYYYENDLMLPAKNLLPSCKPPSTSRRQQLALNNATTTAVSPVSPVDESAASSDAAADEDSSSDSDSEEDDPYERFLLSIEKEYDEYVQNECGGKEPELWLTKEMLRTGRYPRDKIKPGPVFRDELSPSSDEENIFGDEDQEEEVINPSATPPNISLTPPVSKTPKSILNQPKKTSSPKRKEEDDEDDSLSEPDSKRYRMIQMVAGDDEYELPDDFDKVAGAPDHLPPSGKNVEKAKSGGVIRALRGEPTMDDEVKKIAAMTKDEDWKKYLQNMHAEADEIIAKKEEKNRKSKAWQQITGAGDDAQSESETDFDGDDELAASSGYALLSEDGGEDQDLKLFADRHQRRRRNDSEFNATTTNGAATGSAADNVVIPASSSSSSTFAAEIDDTRNHDYGKFLPTNYILSSVHCQTARDVRSEAFVRGDTTLDNLAEILMRMVLHKRRRSKAYGPDPLSSNRLSPVVFTFESVQFKNHHTHIGEAVSFLMSDLPESVFPAEPDAPLIEARRKLEKHLSRNVTFTQRCPAVSTKDMDPKSARRYELIEELEHVHPYRIAVDIHKVANLQCKQDWYRMNPNTNREEYQRYPMLANWCGNCGKKITRTARDLMPPGHMWWTTSKDADALKLNKLYSSYMWETWLCRDCKPGRENPQTLSWKIFEKAGENNWEHPDKHEKASPKSELMRIEDVLEVGDEADEETGFHDPDDDALAAQASKKREPSPDSPDSDEALGELMAAVGGGTTTSGSSKKQDSGSDNWRKQWGPEYEKYGGAGGYTDTQWREYFETAGEMGEEMKKWFESRHKSDVPWDGSSSSRSSPSQSGEKKSSSSSSYSSGGQNWTQSQNEEWEGWYSYGSSSGSGSRSNQGSGTPPKLPRKQDPETP
ncbi:unnamed protein product [Amoebophrya sp. A120]|nr:unnamed protein product [Amoebophrya sp. A120]|eukprot:GSA120T00012568001.1